MRLELNVGLWIDGKPNANFGIATVLRDTFSTLGHVMNELDGESSVSRQIAASGEPTVVMAFDIRGLSSEALEGHINFLSQLLGQDCIAGKLDGAGFLYGPNTAPYGGAFNPDYWLSPR